MHRHSARTLSLAVDWQTLSPSQQNLRLKWNITAVSQASVCRDGLCKERVAGSRHTDRKVETKGEENYIKREIEERKRGEASRKWKKQKRGIIKRNTEGKGKEIKKEMRANLEKGAMFRTSNIVSLYSRVRPE